MALSIANRLPQGLKGALPVILPVLVVGSGRLMTFSDWAATNPGWAAMLFGWLVIDSLALGLLAKAPRHRPTFYQFSGLIALSGVVLLAGASSEVRAIYLGFPQLVSGFAMTLVLFLSWTGLRMLTAYRKSQDARAAAEAVLPPILVHFLLAEIRTLHLALFSWRTDPDVPAGWRAFSYHTYLVPMIATFVALQVIELAVVHFLLMLWNPLVAWVLLGISLWGVIWTVALLKSFRINPVLLSSSAIRARSGIIHDLTVPLADIGDCTRAFTADELKDKQVLNLAILSSPNVSLRLTHPIEMATILGGKRTICGIALRLEDSAAFLSELESAQDPASR